MTSVLSPYWVSQKCIRVSGSLTQSFSVIVKNAPSCSAWIFFVPPLDIYINLLFHFCSYCSWFCSFITQICLTLLIKMFLLFHIRPLKKYKQNGLFLPLISHQCSLFQHYFSSSFCSLLCNSIAPIFGTKEISCRNLAIGKSTWVQLQTFNCALSKWILIYFFFFLSTCSKYRLKHVTHMFPTS